MPGMIEVCFSIDKNTEACGFVAVHSLLAHATEKVSVMVCYDREEKLPGANWNERLRSFGFDFDLRHQMIDNSAFRRCKSMYDSFAAYLRLSAPEYALTDRLIYIDADVIITGDLADMYRLDFSSAVIAFRQSGCCGTRREKERDLLYDFGREAGDPYYGSAVAVIDVPAYRGGRKLEKAKDLAIRHAPSLLLWDQTIWNCVFFKDEIAALPERWCQDPVLNTGPGITHFCGCPKPWDLLGEFFHPSFKVWKAAADRAGLFGTNGKNYLSAIALRRACRLRKQYPVWFR